MSKEALPTTDAIDWDHPHVIAKKIAADQTYRFANGDWYRWTGTHYERVPFMEGVVDALVEAQFEAIRTAHNAKLQQNEKPMERKIVTRELNRLVRVKLQTQYECDGRQPANKINFKNGILNTEDVGTFDVQRVSLGQHDPRHFFVGAPTVRFDPNETAPKWAAFLEEVLPEENARTLLQRWFGYCLTNDTSRQKCLMLCGASRAGKGIISRVLTDVVGHDRTASVQLQALSNAHALQPLLGKALALVDESTLDFKSDKGPIVSTLLKIIGESTVAVNPKFKDAIPAVKLNTRFLFAANDLVNFGDSSGAMANRMLYLSFTKSFAGREDLGLYDRLRAELEGIVVWALHGLVDLQRNGFPEVESSKALVQKSKALNNHVLRFVEECIEFDETATTASRLVYDTYQIWCKENGLHHCAENVFADRLLAASPATVRKERVRAGGGRRPMQWFGLRVVLE